MSYILELETYKGPIEKLLELVEEKKLPINTVSLAKVTGDFVAYFQELQTREISGTENSDEAEADLKFVLAEFLVVASRLILIKSKELVPDLELTEEEEADIRDLEFRLKFYQNLKGAKINIARLWEEKPRMFCREFLMNREPVFFPPQNVTPRILENVIARLLGILEQELLPTKKIPQTVMPLREKINHILERLSHIPISIGALGGKTKGELVVLFLAVLHLVRDQLIEAEQKEHLGEIVIAKKAESL